MSILNYSSVTPIFYCFPPFFSICSVRCSDFMVTCCSALTAVLLLCIHSCSPTDAEQSSSSLCVSVCVCETYSVLLCLAESCEGD